MTDLLRRGMKLGHLRLLAELAETGQIGLAAGRLGIAQPAASRLLAEAEAMAGVALRARDGRGIALTDAGRALAVRARRVLAEIASAGREIDEGAAGLTGHVRIGAVTGAALERVLPVLRTARVALPGITVEVEVGTTDSLTAQLRDGRLDLALCRLPDADPAGFDITLFAPEPVSLVVRQGHALAGPARGPVPRADLLRYDWLMPGPAAILHRTVLDRLAVLGLPAPPGRMSTSSFLLTLAWLAQSNAIAPLATAVARAFAGVGHYAILDDDLGITVAPYGLVTLAGTVPTPAAARLCALIVQAPVVAAETTRAR